jgi:hypothetical protein
MYWFIHTHVLNAIEISLSTLFSHVPICMYSMWVNKKVVTFVQFMVTSLAEFSPIEWLFTLGSFLLHKKPVFLGFLLPWLLINFNQKWVRLPTFLACFSQLVWRQSYDRESQRRCKNYYATSSQGRFENKYFLLCTLKKPLSKYGSWTGSHHAFGLVLWFFLFPKKLPLFAQTTASSWKKNCS